MTLSTGQASLKFYAGVFLVTAATLMLQIIETRILSVMAFYHMAFFVISLAMFGLTAGAVWVYLQGERFTEASLGRDLTVFASGFAITTAISLIVLTTLVLSTALSLSAMLVWVELAILLSVPFFFAGVTVSLALTRSPYPIERVYGVDLIGAAFGCLGVLALLSLTDGPSAILWVAVLAALAAWCFAALPRVETADGQPWFRRLIKRPSVVLITLLLLAVGNGLTSHGFQPLIVKDKLERRGDALHFEDWNSFSRVAVHRSKTGRPYLWGASPKLPAEARIHQRLVGTDGATAGPMYRYDGDPSSVDFLRYDVTNLAYALPNLESAAIVGVAGGRDVLSASIFGVSEITGVDFNPIYIRLLETEPGFADYANLRDLDGVRFVVDEARSWFARNQDHYDLIQMSMIDTWAATSAGAFTLAENGLYSVEAWQSYLDHLTPHGVLTVSRWYAPGDVNEVGRLVSLTVAALLERGAKDPSQHIFLASAWRIASLIVSNEPLTAAQIAALEQKVAALDFKVLLSPDRPPASAVLQGMVAARDRAALDAAVAGYDLDLSPPDDDRPFFFNQLPFYKPLTILRLAFIERPGGVVLGNLEAAATLLLVVMISISLVVGTIVLPLRRALADVGPRLTYAGTAYFCLIGFGFLVIEIALLQRLSIFLGHPVYALSVALFSLILSTGLGSLLSGRYPLSNRKRYALWSSALALYLLLLPFWLPTLLSIFAGYELVWRALICIVAILPAGLLMGFAFPTGMKLIGRIDRRPTPWFWGINGAAGVLASGTAVMSGIAFGITTTLLVGALCYVLLLPVGLLLLPKDQPAG